MEFPIKIIVKPSSKKEKIEFLGDFYKVNVKEKAENNRANLAVIKILSKYKSVVINVYCNIYSLRN